jgi:hypothetical protein
LRAPNPAITLCFHADQLLAQGYGCRSPGDFARMDNLTISLPREISYEWSPDLVKLGARRFIMRYAGRRMLVFLTMIGVLVAGLAIMGEASWWILAIVAVIPPLLWLAYYYRVTRTCYDMPDRRVTIRIDQETITFQTSETSSTLKWSGIKKLWSFKDVLLLFTYTKQNYSAVPVEPLGEELRCYIEKKIEENGGEVA